MTSPYLTDIVQEIGVVETLPQALVLFETVGMPARNLAVRTRQEYHNDITDLIVFLQGRGISRLSEVGLRDLEAYQAEMDHRAYQSSTRNRKTHALKGFFAFLLHQGITKVNVASRLIPPSVRKKEPRFLNEDEYHRLLRACSHHVRDAAIVEVLLQTGMRLSELAGLKVTDVVIPTKITRDPDNTGTAYVRRKGGKEAAIPLNYKACGAIAAYLKIRPQVDILELFLSKRRTAFGKRDVQRRVHGYLVEVGITDASVHTLRHTMATHHVARGTDLKTVQEALGHAKLETTAIYVSLAKKAQRKALQEHAL